MFKIKKVFTFLYMVGVELLKKMKELDRGMTEQEVLHGSFFYVFSLEEYEFFAMFVESIGFEKLDLRVKRGCVEKVDEGMQFCFHNRFEFSKLIDLMN